MEIVDRKYRVYVLMNRADRPRYYTFNCPFCTKPLAEIVNCDVQAVSDVINPNNTKTYGVGVMCFSRQCRDIWYYFNLNSG